MPEILINVVNKIPQMTGDVRQITAGNRDYRLRLIFDDDWEDGEKTVLFVRRDGHVYPPVRTENDECAVPEITNVQMKERLYIGVKQGDVHTSRPCDIPVFQSIDDLITDDAIQPELSMWENVIARLETLETNIGFTPGSGLEVDKDGKLNVKTTAAAEADNLLPISSAGVYAIVGNIGAILDTI